MKKLRIFGLLLGASLSVAAAQAQSTWYLEGCWSPYPNCAGSSAIYRDGAGRFYNCGRCGTVATGPASCRQVGNLYTIGYWCS